MFNKVILVGNLTRDIEMRYMPSGSAIGATAIAVTRRYNSSSGEKKEETCFIDISFFGRSAEIANQYLSKGSKVLVEGRLRFEQWSDQNGQNRSKHSIYVENMEMLGSNPNLQNNFSNSQTSNSYANKNQQSFDPYANDMSKNQVKTSNMQNQNYQEEKIKEIDINDFDINDKDELPF